MKKITKAISAIFKIMKNPWLLNKILADDSNWNSYLNSNHRTLTSLPIIELDQLTTESFSSIDTFSFLDGSSLITDIALLKILCKKFKDCRYFEIGTWRGESVINVSDVCKECYTLNLSKDEILKTGGNEIYANLHGFFSKHNEKIIHLYGNSMHYDFQSLNKKFDVLFIDGNHQYDFVKNDTIKVFSHLIHDHSVVVWHDYAYNPEMVRPEVLAGILDGLDPANRRYLYHVANTMCAIFIKEEFKTSILESPMTPKKRFSIKLNFENL
jgi:predicted O-methyltransferase YrrM